jgi:hypothetical protein
MLEGTPRAEGGHRPGDLPEIRRSAEIHLRLSNAAGLYGNRAARVVPKLGVDNCIRVQLSLSNAKEFHTINRNRAFNADEITGDPGRPGCEHDNGIALPAISGEGRKTRSENQTEEINRLEAGPPGGDTPDGP